MINFKNFKLRSIFFLCILPIVTFALVIHHLIHFGISWKVIGLTIFYYYATGMAITAGYHRLFSHRTYEASLPVRLFYIFFGAGAFQDSIITWCTDHRYHHNYTDTEKDPYNAQRGFWFSHMGWMLSKKTPVDAKKGELMTRDLRKDPWVLFQHKYYTAYALFSGFLTPALIGWCFGEAYSAFLFAGLFRTVMVHQYTFLINSAAHKWGRQTYGTRFSAKDNALLSFFTYGEGYHNFHHHFQNDYRNGVKWYDFDPTKWMIYGFKKMGLAHSLRKAPDHEIIQARIFEEYRLLNTAKLVKPIKEKLDQIQHKVNVCSDKFKKMQSEYIRLASELRDEKDHRLKMMQIELYALRKEIKVNYRHWQKMMSLIQRTSLVRA